PQGRPRAVRARVAARAPGRRRRAQLPVRGVHGAPALYAAVQVDRRRAGGHAFPGPAQRRGGAMKRAALLALSLVAVGCAPKAGAPPPRSTLVVGLDVSGSFRNSGRFDDAMRYAALYIYGHVNGLGGLKQSTDVFVGSLGGDVIGQPKTFHPIQDLSGKTPGEIEHDLRAWFPDIDALTDFNAFFQRVAVH